MEGLCTYQGRNLQQGSGAHRRALQEQVGKEIIRRIRQVLCQKIGDTLDVGRQIGQSLDSSGSDGDDQEHFNKQDYKGY